MPGLANRIVKMAEDESAHRREFEKQVVAAQVADAKDYRSIEHTGQHYAMGIACLTILLGFIAILYGHPVSGGALSGGTILGLVALFIYGRERKTADLRSNAETPEAPSTNIQTADDAKT